MAPNIAWFHYPFLVFSRGKNDSADFILIFHFFWGLTLDSKEKRRGGVQQCFGMTVPDSWSRRTSTHGKKNWVWMLEPLTKSEQKGGNKSKNNLCHPRFRCFFLNICLLIPTTNLCNNCHYSHSSPLESRRIVPHLPMPFHHCSLYVPFPLLNYLPWPYRYLLLFILSFTWQAPVYHSDYRLGVI